MELKFTVDYVCRIVKNTLWMYKIFSGGRCLTHQWPYHCLTDRVIFFNQVFDPVHQWPSHSLTDRVFSFFSNKFSTLNVSDHTTVPDCLRKKKRSHRPWYGHWGLLNFYGHWLARTSIHDEEQEGQSTLWNQRGEVMCVLSMTIIT